MNEQHTKFFFGYQGILMLILTCWFVKPLRATDSDTTGRKRTFVAYPAAFYTPETRFSLGVGGALNFRIHRKDLTSPTSQISFIAGITQNHQSWFALPFALYFKERTHTISGELSYYDFSYDFYGIGEENKRGVKEKYDIFYPLFRLNYLYKFRQHMFVGARWWYQSDHIGNFPSNPALPDSFPGKAGGVSSGPGLVFLYDSRDNIYYSKKGSYLELVAHHQHQIWGSDFAFQRLRFDYRNFQPISHDWIIASNVFGDFTLGDVPFTQLALLGNGKRGRGFYQGRFRDNQMVLYQGEVRKVLDKRWAFAGFWNYALMSDKLKNVSLRNDHASVGFGFRYAFDTKERINLRLDFSWPVFSGVYLNNPDDALKVYFGINESF